MRSLLFFFSVLLCATSFADVRLPRVLSDHMILQREMPVTLWGWADEGESVEIQLNGNKLAHTSAKNGKWQIQIAKQKAGGPHTLSVIGKNTVELKDIYFGDVWLASGQSNMQTTMARVEERFPNAIRKASHPLLRQFTVPRVMTFTEPQEDLNGGEWQLTTPHTVPQHSATAYFFGRKIMQEENVPVGILSSNFGGSPAECWMNLQALESYPEAYQRALSLQDEKHLQALKDADAKDGNAWYSELNAGDKGSKAAPPWQDPAIDHSEWSTLNVPGLWEDQGLEAMAGIVWFRKVVDLPADFDGGEGFLRLGTIVDADVAYINGVEVGRTGYQYPPRRYSVKKGVLKPGKNTIALRIQVNNKRGEFIPEKPYYLEAGGKKYSLTGSWHYKIGNVMASTPPALRFTPWNEPLGCFNAMLAPLFNLKIKGVIWYQGESNTGKPAEYATLFPHLIRHWREKFDQGDFPFIFVQLANYMKAEPEPSESTWAELRFSQFKSLSEPNTAMAVAIDVGEWNDLHPLDKKSVGERLALAAQALAYDRDIVYSGPLLKSAKRKKNKVVLNFTHIGSGLLANGEGLGGFAIAGEDGKFVWAQAEISGKKVIVWHPQISEPQKVRYAWANTPEDANLYNKEGLPASPFEVEL